MQLPSTLLLNSSLYVHSLCTSLESTPTVGWFPGFLSPKNFWRRVFVSSFKAFAATATDPAVEVEVAGLPSSSLAIICLWARFCWSEWENLSFRCSSVRTWLSSIPTLVTTTLVLKVEHLFPTWDTFEGDTQGNAWQQKDWEGRCLSLDTLDSSSFPELVWQDICWNSGWFKVGSKIFQNCHLKNALHG